VSWTPQNKDAQFSAGMLKTVRTSKLNRNKTFKTVLRLLFQFHFVVRTVLVYVLVLRDSQERTGPPGCMALARWTGWSAGLVDRHVKCWRREWNGGGGPEALS